MGYIVPNRISETLTRWRYKDAKVSLEKKIPATVAQGEKLNNSEKGQ